jgi:succinoglycan biosynthesis transport protein ExoP
MFFDDATKRKPAGKVQLRLAANNGASESRDFEGRESEAARRHRAARTRREPAGPSLLDQIDAISERQAIAERESMARAELEAEMAELAATEIAAGKNRRNSFANNRNTSGFTEEEPENRVPHAGYQSAQSESQDGAPLIDPRFVFRSVRSLRYLIAATTMLGGLAGVYVAMNTPKLYFSSATIVIDPRNYKVIENDLNPDVFLSEAALAIVDSQVSLMRSPKVLEKVAAKLKLSNDPEFNGSSQGGLGSFLNILSGSKIEDYEGGALKYLAEHMSAERSPKTFVVNVGAYSQDPEKAALIANTIVDVYLEEQASNRSDLAKRTSGELGSRLENLKSDVEKAENKVEAFKSENNLFGAQGRLIEDEEILRVNDQLTAARSTTITLNSRAQSAKSATVEAVASGGLPEEVASTGLTALRSQYVAAKQRRDGLSAKLGPMHPDLQQANNEMVSVTGAINAEINRIRQSIQTDLKRAVETEQQLASRLAQLKARQGGSGEAQVELRELEREAASARTVYEQYLLRARETGEQGNINANNVQKISDARSADAPEGASRKFIVLGGAIAGFIAGLALAIAKGMFDALKVRFVPGSGDGAPSPSAPPKPSGGGTRRRMSRLFAGNTESGPCVEGSRRLRPHAPQPAMNVQQPAEQTPSNRRCSSSRRKSMPSSRRKRLRFCSQPLRRLCSLRRRLWLRNITIHSSRQFRSTITSLSR